LTLNAAVIAFLPNLPNGERSVTQGRYRRSP
jgi:hypothetical protein